MKLQGLSLDITGAISFCHFSFNTHADGAVRSGQLAGKGINLGHQSLGQCGIAQSDHEATPAVGRIADIACSIGPDMSVAPKLGAEFQCMQMHVQFALPLNRDPFVKLQRIDGGDGHRAFAVGEGHNKHGLRRQCGDQHAGVTAFVGNFTEHEAVVMHREPLAGHAGHIQRQQRHRTRGRICGQGVVAGKDRDGHFARNVGCAGCVQRSGCNQCRWLRQRAGLQLG